MTNVSIDIFQRKCPISNEICLTEGKGPFNNHVDIILLFFDHPPTSVDIFYVLNVDKNGYFQTTYPPPFVHVVIECPHIQTKIFSFQKLSKFHPKISSQLYYNLLLRLSNFENGKKVKFKNFVTYEKCTNKENRIFRV